MFSLTGLAHDERSHIAYESAINQRAMQRRSAKLAALRRTLRPPEVNGDPDGDLLVVGWGSTRGAIEEAVARVRADGHRVGSLCLRFLSPLEPGLEEIFARYRKVMTVEINYSDDADGRDASERRYAQLAWVLRAATRVDVDCWSRVPGQPLPPRLVEASLRDRLRGVRRCTD
jgi:2-oxoglutarate ferredoxin oxidoreductase subunit alpha